MNTPLQIAAIHATRNAIQPMADTFFALAPCAILKNYLNEEMLAIANSSGGATPASLRMFAKLIFQAAEEGAQGIIVCCSVYCPYIDLVKPFLDIPIIAVDTAMLEKAVQTGSNIGIIATNRPAGPTTEKQILAEAEKNGKKVSCQIAAVLDAADALKTGDIEKHNQLIAKAGKSLVEHGCDTIVLAQITIAGAKSAMTDISVPILTSPLEGAARLLSMIY